MGLGRPKGASGERTRSSLSCFLGILCRLLHPASSRFPLSLWLADTALRAAPGPEKPRPVRGSIETFCCLNGGEAGRHYSGGREGLERATDPKAEGFIRHFGSSSLNDKLPPPKQDPALPARSPPKGQQDLEMQEGEGGPDLPHGVQRETAASGQLKRDRWKQILTSNAAGRKPEWGEWGTLPRAGSARLQGQGLSGVSGGVQPTRGLKRAREEHQREGSSPLSSKVHPDGVKGIGQAPFLRSACGDSRPSRVAPKVLLQKAAGLPASLLEDVSLLIQDVKKLLG